MGVIENILHLFTRKCFTFLERYGNIIYVRNTKQATTKEIETMIKIECAKTYTMNFTVSHREEYIYELAKTYIALQEVGKSDSDVVEKIFEWLKDNTRQFVPFKTTANEYPSFRIVKARKSADFFFHIEWALSKEINEYL